MAFEIFERAGDSTGGCVREGGEGAVAGLRTRRQQHDWTCPQPHGNAVFFFLLLKSLMSSPSSYGRDTEIPKEHDRRRPS